MPAMTPIGRNVLLEERGKKPRPGRREKGRRVKKKKGNDRAYGALLMRPGTFDFPFHLEEGRGEFKEIQRKKKRSESKSTERG